MPDPIVTEPTAIFMLIMAVILIAPLLSERVRLPGIVGLILGGVLIGRHGLNLLKTGPIIDLFGTVGLIYLMFDAGLEIDLCQFQRVRNRAIVFAAISFSLPQLSGVAIGRFIGLGWAAAVLLGATYASQTLIAYPIIRDLGIIRNEPVALTVGATVFTDVAALLILAVLTGSQDSAVSPLLVGKTALLTLGYATLILLGVHRLGKLFFRHFSGAAVEFQFVLVVLFVAAVLAEFIGMHAIVGAFLAGLALNSTLPENSKVTGRVLFVGDSFFIPLFLVTVGMRLNPAAVVTNVRTLLIGLALTAAVYATKFGAAWLTARLYHYERNATLTMWGLSQAQAAATLAIVLVGINANIFPQYVLNAVIVMVLFTAISSPLLVQFFGSRLTPPEPEKQQEPAFKRILFPITRAEPSEELFNLATMLARRQNGTVLQLNVAHHEKELEARQGKLDTQAVKETETELETLRRIESNPAEGILRESTENEASMIIMSWDVDHPAKDRIFDETLDKVIWEANVPVLAGQLNRPTKALERTILVIASHTLGVKLDDRTVELAREIGDAFEMPFVVLATAHYLEELTRMVSSWNNDDRHLVIALDEDNLVEDIVHRLNEDDLLILTTMGSRQRFASSDDRIPKRLLDQVSCSLFVVHRP